MLPPDLEDFDPTWDLLAASHWLLKAADCCEKLFQSHPNGREFCGELRSGAIAGAYVHGQYCGAIKALRPVVPHIPDALSRMDRLQRQYTADRAVHIYRICKLYIDAVVMTRDINLTPGRPRLRMPDYDALSKPIKPEKAHEIIRHAFEFDIAVKLASEKKRTGRYAGLQKLLSEAIEQGKIDDIGDTQQRIRRLARQIHEESNLYLTPGLFAAQREAPLFIYSAE